MKLAHSYLKWAQLIICIFDDLKVVEQGLAEVLIENKYGFIQLP